MSESLRPRTVASQMPLSMGFFRHEYWSELLFPPPGDLPDPGIEPGSPAWEADSLTLSHLGRLELKINCTSNRQGLTLARHPMTDLKMTVRADCAVSACNPHLILSLNALTHCLSAGGLSLWTDVRHPPLPQLPASEIKQTFLPMNPAC